MRDVMRVLRDARPEEMDPSAPVDEGVRRAELARAMAAPRAEAGSAAPEGAVRARRRVRPVLGLGLAAAATAGAIAAAAVLIAPGDGGTEPAKRGGGGERVLDARTVLLAAADKADGQPETTGAYWHQVTISSTTDMARTGGERFAVTLRGKSETWTPRKPGGKLWVASQNLGAKPATKADEEAWRRAGSPGTLTVEVPSLRVKHAPKTYKAKTAPGPRWFSGAPMVGGDKVYWIGRNVSMKDLRSLPTDPKRLKADLLRWYKGHDTESDRPMSKDRWLYTVASGLLMDIPVSSAVRAAVFRMLAELPEVRSLGKVTDPEGRTGNAIAVREKTRQGVTEEKMIIDLASGTALARVLIMVAPAPGSEVPAGRTMNSTTQLTAGWTDAKPR
ncbi:CU044_5270 family protein [Spirillospora sp. NPDC049024]